MYRLIGILTITVFLSVTATVDAQLFRRFRQNTYQQQYVPQQQFAPQQQYVPQQQIQQTGPAKPQFAQPQIQGQQYYNQPAAVPQPALSAPRPVAQNPQTTGYRLTYDAYGQVVAVPVSGSQYLTPAQNLAQPQKQPTSPQPPTASATQASTVRVVTYYDPRTGQTFQRRYLVPPTQQIQPTQATAMSIPGVVERKPVATVANQVLPNEPGPLPTPSVVRPTTISSSNVEMVPAISGPATTRARTAQVIPSVNNATPLANGEIQQTSLEDEIVPPSDEEYSIFSKTDELEPVSDSVIEPTDSEESIFETDEDEVELNVPEFDFSTEETDVDSLEIDLPAISGPRK